MSTNPQGTVDPTANCRYLLHCIECWQGYPPEQFRGQREDFRRCTKCQNSPATKDNIRHNIQRLLLENNDVLSNQRMDEALKKANDHWEEIVAFLKASEESHYDYLINDFMNWFKIKQQIKSDDADTEQIILDNIFRELPNDAPSIRMALLDDAQSIAALNERKEEYIARMYVEYEREMSLAKKLEVVEKASQLAKQKELNII